MFQYIAKAKDKPPNYDFIRNVLKQLCQGIEFMHSKGIIHRDMKCQNVLITKDDKVKIADFGLSRSVRQPLQKMTREV